MTSDKTMLRTFVTAELIGGQFDGDRRIQEVTDGRGQTICVPIPIVFQFSNESAYGSLVGIPQAEYQIGKEISFVSIAEFILDDALESMRAQIDDDRTKITRYYFFRNIP